VEDVPVVRLRGLPWDTTSQDVEKFLEGVNIGPEGVILTLDQRGRPSGEALVECATLDDADLAMGKNNAYLGTRWIEVFPAGYQDLEFAKKNQNLSATKPELTEEDLSAFGNPDPAYKGVVRMRGLPFRATEEDVVDFFEGYTIVPDGVFLCRLADGRLSGDAFVEFADEEIARKSLELNREQMGRRYVELFPTNKGDMVAAIKIHAQRVMAARRETASSTFVKLRGLPFDVEDFDIQQFFEGYDVVPGSIKIQESFPGRKTGEAFVEFASPEEADRAMQENNKEIGVRYIELFRVRQEEAQGGGDNRKKNRESGSGSSVASDPASTVRMRGMPFRATVADIVMFFEGFDVVKESITLGTSPDGRPSGEAWVAFASPEEATRAIRQMNREYMGNRFVELFPA
jgi:RNA recognition motif-containing protein